MSVIVGICIFLFIISALFGGKPKARPRSRSKPIAPPQLKKPQAVTVRIPVRIDVSHGYEQNEQDERFESRVDDIFGDAIDKRFYSRVAGVTFANDDGVSRQLLVDRCKQFDDILLIREPENPHGSTAIRVTNAAGEKLGYLPHEVAEELSWEIDRNHRQWIALVRHVYRHKVDGHSALVILLLRNKKIATSPPENESKMAVAG